MDFCINNKSFNLYKVKINKKIIIIKYYFLTKPLFEEKR